MVVFHVFKIIQMVPKRATYYIFRSLTSNLEHIEKTVKGQSREFQSSFIHSFIHLFIHSLILFFVRLTNIYGNITNKYQLK